MVFQLLLTFAALVLLSALSEARVLDKKTDNCFYGLRHRDTPSADLLAKMILWKTDNMKRGDRINEHDCRGPFAGCQTYSCIDKDGNQIFVVNSCAPDGGNCTHGDLDPFCSSENGTPKCEICHKGLCNRHKVELLEKNAAIQRQSSSKESSADSDEAAAEREIESDDATDL